MARWNPFYAFAALFLSIGLAFFPVKVAYADGHLPESKNMIIHLQPPVETEGFFKISVFSGTEWQEVGKMAFDKYLREQTLTMPDFAAENQVTKVRITQEGGGAAHIDAMYLGERSPYYIVGSQGHSSLEKLSKKDNDLINASKDMLEVIFEPGNTSKILRLTARIENEVIPETPFLFPARNTFTTMSKDSSYYTYRILPDAGGQPVAPASSPFFLKEYSLTGSGHPSGYTYVWVTNDSDNLYVTMDFTPDNTRDGNKDYASVFIKSEEGVQEYRVSENLTEWGVPQFTYSDKAEYQHKLYRFLIPLDSIGEPEQLIDSNIDLAFAAYGTATPNPTPSQHDFGDVCIGQASSPVTVTVYGPAQNINVIHQGPDSSMFEIANNTCSSIATNETCNFEVTFKPTSSGEKSDYLSITGNAYNATVAYNATIALTGSGIVCSSQPLSVPTLSHWGIVIMSLLMFAVAGFLYRKRQRKSS